MDARFTDENIMDAVKLYQSMQASGKLKIDATLQRLNPSAAIEDDGLDLRGRMFRMLPDISNGQVAVLALCWFADKQRQINNIEADFDELFSIQTI